MAVKFGKDGTLYCNTVKYNYKQVRNLVADGTNAMNNNGTGAWNLEVTNVSFSTAGTFVFGTGYCMLKQQMPEPIKGHKYYGAIKFNAQNGFSCADGRFEWQINDHYSLTFAQHAFSSGTGGRYVISSDIKDINDYPSGQSWYLRLFTVGANVSSTYKNFIVVDLTDAFGAGNEPTKEWCDVHILEHNLLNNVGDHLSPIPTTSDYNIGSSYNMSAASYGAWNYHQLAGDVTMPKDVVYFMQGDSSRSECKMSSIKSYYLSPSLDEYAQVFLLLDEAAPSKGADLDFYHPIAEPWIGRTAVGQNSLFCAGGAASRWKKYSVTNSRASFSVGNYPLRFDLNNRKRDPWCYITGLFLTTVSSQVTWYNYNINTGTDINVAAVNKEWCERWVGGPFNSIIHIKDHQNTLIKFGGRGNYVELDYLESTGTQFINSGVGFKNGSSFTYEMRCQYPTTTTTTGTGHHRAGISNTNGQLKVGYTQTSVNALDWHTAKIFWSSGNVGDTLTQTNYVDGVQVGTYSTQPYDSNPYLLFAMCSWTDNTGIPPYSYEKMRISACKIYQNSTLVRDFVPCMRLSDKAIGMYDKVTQSFFGNAGTGNFIFNRVKTTTFNSGSNPTDYDIICNDIEIRPEQNKIVFDKTGTIICKKLVRTLTY